MGLFSFFTKQRQDEGLSLLIDVGSSSVGASLVRIEREKPVHILTTEREDISFQEKLSSSRFLISMNHALENVLGKIQTKTPSIPAHIFCTLSSPWFILKIRPILISEEKPFEITESMLNDFFSKDIEQLKGEFKDIPPEDIEIIEKKIIQVKLNGHEIKDPLGKITKKMELVASVAVSSRRILQSIERYVHHVFPVSSVHFGSFPVATFSAIRDIFPLNRDFLFMDITGETTEVSIVNNDILLGNISFPRGKNFFIREISSGLNTSNEEAITLFGMFIHDKLDKESDMRVQKIVEQSKNEWTIFFEKALATLSQKGSLPKMVFFTSDSDISELFAGMVKAYESELLPNGAVLQARYFDQFIVSDFVFFETEVKRDPFLIIEALFAKKLLPQILI
ncbi:MAG: hypothetical protein PHS95_00465 [Candidatus Pacebacteria bacterium]|nr:hypothetical protein [Candidatus Paceibacterota bacterium]